MNSDTASRVVRETQESFDKTMETGADAIRGVQEGLLRGGECA